MTTVRKIELESIFLISMVALASLYFVVQRNNQGINVRVASPTNQESQENIYSQISPDGTKEVVARVVQNQDHTKTFSFYTKDTAQSAEKLIFSKAISDTASMKIPYNTWSSNNQYFFIQENAVSGKSIFAFQASGKQFSDTENYFDVTEIFKNKETGNNFTEATGWASESLIIINTTKNDGTKGPSYWFEVPSKAILLLATEF